MGGEVDGYLVVFVGVDGFEQGGVDFRRDGDGEQGVFQGVALEDVGEGRRDDGAEAELGQGPGGVYGKRLLNRVGLNLTLPKVMRTRTTPQGTPAYPIV